MTIREIDEKTSIRVKIGVGMACIVTLCTMAWKVATWQSDAYYQGRENMMKIDAVTNTIKAWSEAQTKATTDLNTSVKELTSSVTSLEKRVSEIEIINRVKGETTTRKEKNDYQPDHQ